MRHKVIIVALFFVAISAANNIKASASSPLFVLVAQGQEQPSEAERSMFTQGQTLYNQGRYEQAAIVLQNLLRNFPNSGIADLTLLWLGRSYIQLRNFTEAERVAQRLRGYKESPFIEIYDKELRDARRGGARPSAPARDANAENLTRPNMTPSPRPTPPNVQPSGSASVSSSTTLIVPSPSPEPTPTPRPQRSNRSKSNRAANAKGTPPTLIIPPPRRQSEPPNNAPSNSTGNESSARNNPNVPNSSNPSNIAASNSMNASTASRAGTGAKQAIKITSPHVTLHTEQYSTPNIADGTFVYRLTLTNDGGSTAQNIVVDENLSEGLQFVSSEPRLASPDISSDGRHLVWRVSALPPNKTAVLLVRARLKPGFAAQHTITYQDANGNPYR